MLTLSQTGRLVLPLTLLLAGAVTAARGQAPASDPGASPPSPNWNRPRESNAGTLPPPAPPGSGVADTAPVSPLPPVPPFAEPPPPGVFSAPPSPPPAPGAAATAGGFASTLPGGGRGLGAVLSPVVGQVPLSGGYQAVGFFDAPVRGQDTHLGYLQQDLNAITPIWQDVRNELYATARVGVESFFTHAVLPNTGQPLPAELWNVSVGTGYRHLFDNGWIGGASVSVGSASDKPFHSIDEMTVSASATLRVPRGDRDAWVFGVNLSSNSQVLPFVPIPFVAYLYNPSDRFQALVGFPFASVTYRPWDDLTFSASYALLTTFHARVSYRVAPPVSVFCALDFDNENYYLADRTDANQRFFNYSDRLSGGVHVVLARQALLEVSGGYVFDRVFFEGTGGTDQSFNKVSVAPGAFLGAKLQIRY